MKIYKLSFFLLPFVAIMAGCKKYAIIPSLKDPAYIRVFNDLNNPVDVFHSQQAAPFLTFLMDPKTDGNGVPNDAALIGDNLGTRQLFSLSYPINEANSSVGNQLIDNNNHLEPPLSYPVNYEYPGNSSVLSASFINGFDLSAWAQAPSGKHRIMFVVRPQSNTGFKDLSAVQRADILLDTTVNFEKGEVYTLEVVSRDLDNSKYGLYIRQEQFIHQSFQDDKLYVGFTNLSGKTPLAGKYGIGFFFWNKININYSYNILNDAVFNLGTGYVYNTYPGYSNNYYTTLSTKMNTSIPYLALPLLPESSFFNQGLLRTYTNSLAFVNATIQGYGSLPYFSFTLSNADLPVYNPNTFPVETFQLNCSADPNTINNYDIKGSTVTKYTPNLNLVVNTGNTYHVYGTLNIMEIVYDRVYLMQVQRGFNEIPKN